MERSTPFFNFRKMTWTFLTGNHNEAGQNSKKLIDFLSSSEQNAGLAQIASVEGRVIGSIG